MRGRNFKYGLWSAGLAFAYVVALGLLGFAVLFVWHGFDDLREAADKGRQFDAAASNVRHLNEDVRRAVEMAVASGDERWVAHYTDDLRALQTSLREAQALLPLHDRHDGSISAADAANGMLRGLEATALRLAGEDERERARLLLQSGEYARWRTTFREGAARFVLQGQNELAALRANVDGSLRAFILTVLGAVAVLLGLFVAIAHVLRRQAQALAGANAGLEARVRERTASLEAERKKFRDFAETTSDWFWESDAGLRITSVSDNFAPATGIAKEDFVGLNLLQLEPSDQHGQMAGEWRPLLTRGLDVRNMYVMVNSPSRGRVYLLLTARAVHGDGDGFTGYRGTAADVTDVLIRARATHQAQKLQALGTMAAGLAHEFNNILAIVMGYAETLRGGLRGNAEAIGGLDEILEAGRRGTSLSKSLLSFGRTTPTGARDTFDARALIDELPRLLKPLLGPAYALQVEPADEPLWLSADRDLLLQGVVNLVVNARDAMPRGGTIKVGLDRETAGSERIRRAGLSPDKDFVAIKVADTGAGMSRETVRRIFDPFFTTKKVGKGTGLGLSLLFSFVRDHHGSVDVDSVPGAGTIFVVLLPRATAPATRATSGLRGAADFSGLRVLLVDDEPQLLKIYEQMLRGLGIDVVAHSDLDVALGLLDDESERIDLIVSDVLMPQMSGFRFAELARSLRPGLDVLFITGQPERESEERDGGFKSAPILRKPFGLDELGAALGGLLSKSEAA